MSLERKIVAGFTIALVALAFVNVVSYRTATQFLATTESVDHAHEVLESIDLVLARVQAVEAGGWGYVITGRESFAEPAVTALADLDLEVDRLRRLTADNPYQQQQLDALGPLVARRTNSTRSVIELRRAKGFEAAAQQVLTERGRATMEEIRRLTAALRDEERVSLQRRRQAAAESLRRTATAQTLGSVLAFVLLIFAAGRAYRDVRQRNRAEQALRQRETELNEAQRVARVGSWNWETVTDAVTWSPELYRVFGRDPRLPAPSYKEHPHIYTPESWARLNAAVQATLQTGKPYELELEFIRPDGISGWIMARGEGATDEQGRVVRLRGTGEDVTERHRAQMALRESEERFRSLVTATAQVVWTTNAAGEVVDPSESWQAFSGQSAAEMKGWGWTEPLHPDDRDRVKAVWAQAVESRSMYEVEFRARRFDGAYRDFAARGVPVLALEGHIREWVGTCTDITERKRTQEELRTSEERLKALVQNASDAICVVDANTIIQYASPAVERLIGVRPADLVGTSATLYVHPDDLDALTAGFAGVGAGGSYRAEHRTRHAAGFWVPVETTGTVRLDDPAIRGTVLNIRGISDRKRMEEQRAEFIAMLVHDIRNPIGVIAGYIDMLVDSDGLPATAHELLSVSERSVRSLLLLVENYLHGAKIQAGRLILANQPVQVNEILEGIGRCYEPECTRRRIALGLDLLPGLPFVNADPVALERVFTNLVQNALKFTPDAGRITIRSGQEGRSVVVCVADTGPGIAAEELPNLFAPYGQTSSGRSQGGSGLGLFIVKSIVEAHGGTVQVASTLGLGSRFVVRLATQPSDA